MKKHLIAISSFLLIAAVSNAQTTAPKKFAHPANKQTSLQSKKATPSTSAANSVSPAPKVGTAPTVGIKRKHHYKKNTEAVKTKAN